MSIKLPVSFDTAMWCFRDADRKIVDPANVLAALNAGSAADKCPICGSHALTLKFDGHTAGRACATCGAVFGDGAILSINKRIQQAADMRERVLLEGTLIVERRMSRVTVHEIEKLPNGAYPLVIYGPARALPLDGEGE